MEFVARGVAVEFGEPPIAAVRRRRAVLAPAMPMPEAAVDEDGGFVFREKDVGADKTRSAECRTRNRAREHVSLFFIPHSAFRIPCFHRDSQVQSEAVAHPV